MVRNAQIRVAEFQPGDEQRWDSFVETCEVGTFFHLSGWKKIIENALGHPTTYLYCESEGRIKGVLPLAQVKSWLFGNSLMSLPFLVYGGPLAVDDEVEELLVAAACAKAREIGADYLEFRNRNASGRSWPTADKYVTFSKKIDPDPEKNLLAIPRKQRAMIRKGIKADLTAERDQCTNRLYTALLECKRNLGTPFLSRRYLKYVCEVFGERAEITTITKSGEAICSVMSFRFRNEVLPYYGGGGNAARALNGNDFMYWAVMEKACADGVEVFDYGRSLIGSGAYRFKKHWGFEPVPLAYEYFLVGKKDIPNLNPSNPKYGTLINAWKRLPLSIAGLIGPPIARRIG